MSSAAEAHEGEPVEQRSSIQIEMDSKGLAKVRIKLYAGEDMPQFETARLAAISAFNKTRESVGA